MNIRESNILCWELYYASGRCVLNCFYLISAYIHVYTVDSFIFAWIMNLENAFFDLKYQTSCSQGEICSFVIELMPRLLVSINIPALTQQLNLPEELSSSNS